MSFLQLFKNRGRKQPESAPPSITIVEPFTAPISPEQSTIPVAVCSPVTECFSIPDEKICATHLLGEAWAIDFWSYLNLNLIDLELIRIKRFGFNTVIVLVPWVGFQSSIHPIQYHEEYWDLLAKLLAKINTHQLKVILRIAYAHEHGVNSDHESITRALALVSKPEVKAAWQAYVARLWQLVSPFNNVLGGFITWEDFYFMHLIHAETQYLVKLAEESGYQAYLAQHYRLEEVSECYQTNFNSFAEVPIPRAKMSAIRWFSDFWDDVLLNVVFQPAKQQFPRLSMEVRIDCELFSDTEYHCHQALFDIDADTPMTAFYYSPAWGAANTGEAEEVDVILLRLNFLLDKIKAHTNNFLFIDQFNFIDNTPGFEQHTQIKPEQLDYFLQQAALILKEKTIGYSLWLLQDRPANILKNGAFARQYPAWELEAAHITFDVASQKQVAQLEAFGKVKQTIDKFTCAAILPDRNFTFSCNVKLTNMNSEGCLLISVWHVERCVYQYTFPLSAHTEWQACLTSIPFQLGQTLVLETTETTMLITDCYLYQLAQENGILTIDEQPKSFAKEIYQLNQTLQQP